jgi:hypothetical protein
MRLLILAPCFLILHCNKQITRNPCNTGFCVHALAHTRTLLSYLTLQQTNNSQSLQHWLLRPCACSYSLCFLYSQCNIQLARNLCNTILLFCYLALAHTCALLSGCLAIAFTRTILPNHCYCTYSRFAFSLPCACLYLRFAFILLCSLFILRVLMQSLVSSTCHDLLY